METETEIKTDHTKETADNDKISAKLAAIEVVRKDKLIINICVGAVVAIMLSAIAGAFHIYAQMIFIVITVIFILLQIRKAQNEIRYLGPKYQLSQQITNTAIDKIQENLKEMDKNKARL